MELVIFTGLPGSGKSTFYRTQFSRTHALISKDLMRNRKRRQARQIHLLENELLAGRSVVIDNTNVQRADREPLIAMGRTHRIQIIGCYFESNISDSLLRNSLRTGRARVPDSAIYDAAKRLELPSPIEGFHSLFRIRILGEDQFESTLIHTLDSLL